MIDFYFAEQQARGIYPHTILLSSPDAERRIRCVRIPHRYLAMRRIAELAAIAATLPLTAMLCAAIAIAIRMDSRGPLLFRQVRPGRGGRPFRILKFRSMRSEPIPATEFRLTQERDARVTRVGAFLRRHRLDEIPQLWNVLVGDMSLIGPRPEPAELTETYERLIPLYHYRRIIRPGITGWAQVHSGYTFDLETTRERLQDDLFYILNISFTLDMEILLKTVRTVITGFGAR
ncbi:MAG TPA: sugar transferase [Candidatus Kapabacteria bacterium]|nr:sugar transferase [Candidatus Kapabacteria bacterium]